MNDAITSNQKMQDLASSTKLFDLNADCLIKIFEYLKVNDLVNVAEAHHLDDLANQNHMNVNQGDHLMSCLETVFCQNRANQKIVIFNQPHHLEPSIKLLQHFGKLIMSVNLLFADWCRHFDKEIEDHIFKYCIESLHEIHIQNVDMYTMYGKQESFPNVVTVSLRDGKLGEHIGRINKLFPSLSTLELDNLEIIDSECIEEKFPCLEHIYVRNPEQIKFERFEWNDDNKWIFTNSNLRIFFKLNPQLRSVSLMHDVDDDGGRYCDGDHGIKLNKSFLSYMQRKLPQLSKLELKIMQSGLWNGRGLNIDFSNLKHLQIHVRYWDMLWHFPIECKKLNTLNLVCEKDLRINYQKIAIFVKRNPNITTLQLLGRADIVFNLANESMIGLVIDLPNLKYVDVLYPTCVGIIFHDVIQFISHCKSLERLRIYYDYKIEANQQELEQSFQNSAADGLPDHWKMKFSKQSSLLECFSYAHLAHYIIIERDMDMDMDMDMKGM